MPALGQKETPASQQTTAGLRQMLTNFRQRSETAMSILHPKADIRQRDCNVRFVPKADVHSNTSSEVARSIGGVVRPSTGSTEGSASVDMISDFAQLA